MFKSHVVAQLDKLMGGNPEYSEVLLQKNQPGPPRDPSKDPPAAKPGTSTSSAAEEAPPTKKKKPLSRFMKGPKQRKPEGEVPKGHPRLRGQGQPVAKEYCLPDLQKVMELHDYIVANGGYDIFFTPRNGQCMWGAIRRGLEISEEYRNNHLRFQFVLWCVENHGFTFTILKNLLLMEYGHDRISHEEYMERINSEDNPLTDEEIEQYQAPGPFSFISYLKYMLEGSSWGDQGILSLISMMWQITITIVNGDNLSQIKIRHSRPLEDVDLVLLYCGGSHYLGACKYIYIISL